MANQPIQLNELDVIGYADALPEGKGPAVVPLVFRHRTDAERCYVPPFRIAGDWLIEPKSISFAEAQELEREERVTLPKDFKHFARPDHQLWVDVNGEVRYEPTADARHNLQRIYQENLDLATAALRKGTIDEAERYAGIALAADDRALEPRSLIAACHALRGEERQVVFLKNASEKAGHNPGSFRLLLKHYAEAIPAETWESLSFKGIQEVCAKAEIEIWASFMVTHDDYRRLHPLLHQFRRSGNKTMVVVSCAGIEAELMSQRRILLATYAESENWVKERRRTEIMMVAAETMLHESIRVAKAYQTTEAHIQHLGQMARIQLRPRVVPS